MKFGARVLVYVFEKSNDLGAERPCSIIRFSKPLFQLDPHNGEDDQTR